MLKGFAWLFRLTVDYTYVLSKGKPKWCCLTGFPVVNVFQIRLTFSLNLLKLVLIFYYLWKFNARKNVCRSEYSCYYENVGKNEPVLVEDLPFDIPDTWSWTRLKDIVYNHGQKTPTSDFSYVDIGSIDNKRQKLSLVENIISADKAPSRARKIIKLGDILYSTVRPYLHNMCIVDKDFSCEPIASTGFAVLSCEKGLFNQFLFYYMLSPVFDLYANSTENSKGVAYPAINDDRLYKALIPIPPQAEQVRICLKIKEMLNHIEKDEI